LGKPLSFCGQPFTDRCVPDFLILAALPAEADTVFPRQGRSSAATPFAARTVELPDRRVIIVTCGLGKVNAAAATALWAERVRPAAILMTGTCGRLTDAEGKAFWIASAVQHDYGAALAEGFVSYPAGDWPMGPPADRPFAAMPDPGLGLPHARIASGDAFVADPALAARLTAMGCALVDMEVAAVAQTAQAIGIPWAAIKAPTDDANGDSAGDFSLNLQNAAALAALGAESLIAQL
jgi:adenosylhomocysteine nucleosidase